ncbi:BTAD domain-containing putative transcriptional regulator [Pseudonocardia saturnea]
MAYGSGIVQFGVLGPIEVRVRGVPRGVPSARQRSILAALLVHAGERVSFDSLARMVWRSGPPPDARGTLHAHVSRLRRVLSEDGSEQPLRTSRGGYVLHVDSVGLDAARFVGLTREARTRIVDDPAGALRLFDEALALWRGPAYADVADEEFARAEAARLDEMRLVAVEDQVDAGLALGRHAQLIGELEASVARHPLRERPCAQLMLARYRDGRIAEALQAYRALRCRLADELGLDPSAELQRMEADMLARSGRLALPPRQVVASDPERPAPLTSFVGRAEALDALAALLQVRRIITLTGTGGAGKTRLAAEVADRVADRFPDGLRVVELAPVRTADAVEDVVAAGLGVVRRGAEPLLQTLVTALRPRRTLVLLDNCEHVLDAVAPLVDRLAKGCPRLVVLATSRERLAVDGEQVWPVLPLPVPDVAAVPDPDALAAVPSVRLFCDRATAADPAFRLAGAAPSAVARICRRLDGLPLAIELAAARVGALGPVDLEARLGARFGVLTAGPRDDTGRHRTLRATVDWSYGLLEPAEARTFDRLSVFPGAFDLAAAESLHLPGEAPEGTAALVAALVDKSMLTAEPGGDSVTRFRLLETLREYGAERLVTRGEAAALARVHAEHYVRLAERADVDVRGPAEARGVAALDLETDNLRAAHRWAVDHDRADVALRLSAALHFYAVHRLRDEVLGWAALAAALPTAAGHPLRATACASASFGAAHRGERAAAVELAEQGLAAATDGAGRADALESLAVVAIYEGRLGDTRRFAGAAVAAARGAGDAYRTQWSRHVDALAALYAHDPDAPDAVEGVRRGAATLGNPSQLAWAHYLDGEAALEGDPDRAVTLLEEAIAQARPVGNAFVRGVALVSVSSARGRSTDPGAAIGPFRDIVDHWWQAGDWTHQWTTLRNLVDPLLRLGVDEPAVVLLGATSAAASAPPVYGVGARRLAGAEAVLRARLGPERFTAADARGRGMADDDVVDYVLAQLDLVLAGRTGQAGVRC